MQRFLPLLIGYLLLSMPVQAAERHAFVLGINNYDNVTPLKNAVADAASMAEALRKLGFQTTLLNEPETTRQGIIAGFGKFVSRLNVGDDAVIFYSGHGVDVQGRNYLVPKDAPKPEAIVEEMSLREYLIAFPNLIEQVTSKHVGGNVWIIDACRDNPFAQAGRQFSSPAGLQSMERGNPAGTFVFFSAAAGAVAFDSLPGDPPTEKNGVYTRVFAKLIDERKNDEMPDIAQEARKRVRGLTNERQRPAYYDDLSDPLCFASCGVTLTRQVQTAQGTIANPTDLQIGEAIKTAAAVSQTAPSPTGASPTASAPTATPSPDADPPNVVYLGKKSAAQNCEKVNTDQRPFGCDVLTKAAGTDAARAQLFNEPHKTITAVYLRMRAPTIEKQGTVYSCPVRTVSEGEAVRFTGIIDVTGAGDTYYWGAVEGTPQKCNNPRKG